MKEIVSVDKAVGDDGLKVQAALGVDKSDLVAQVEARFPIAQVIDPAMKVVDGLVDKIEALIPGDQKALAAKLKAEARVELVELLSEKPA